MTDAFELELANRFRAVALAVDDSDWVDVRRRARRPRRWLALPVAAAIAVVIAGSAFAVRHVVDFFSAEPAPERIVREYNRMAVVNAVLDMHGPRIVPNQVRKVMEAEWRGKPEPFYVVPTEGGGFCYRWATGGSCGRINAGQPRLGVGYVDGANGPQYLDGNTTDPEVTRLELEYEDGTSTELPIVWVSPPIDAGFFAYDVPDEHEVSGQGATALVGYDREGNVLHRQEFIREDPQWETAPDGLPRIADRTQKRTLFDFTAPNGARWTLVTAPAPGDKLCYAHNRGGGCLSPKFPASVRTYDAQGERLCCALPPWVATVELRYEDGERETITPVDGFLLYIMPEAHWKLGHRLERLRFLDAAGTERATRRVRTDVKAVYPCTKEEQLDLGHDVHVCP